MNESNHMNETTIEAWMNEIIPALDPDQDQRAMTVDACMAIRRLIELVAAGGWAPGGLLPDGLEPAPPRMPVGPGGWEPRLLEGGAGSASMEAATGAADASLDDVPLNDDVLTGTQGWRRWLIPPLRPDHTQRAFQADMACALRRLLELLMPVGASLDENGRLVLPRRRHKPIRLDLPESEVPEQLDGTGTHD